RRDDLSPEDRRIWARVTGTVTPARPRKAVRVAVAPPGETPPVPRVAGVSPKPAPGRSVKAPPPAAAPVQRVRPSRGAGAAAATAAVARARSDRGAHRPARLRPLPGAGRPDRLSDGGAGARLSLGAGHHRAGTARRNRGDPRLGA